MLHRLLGEEGKALIEALATVASRRYQRDGVFSVMVEGSVVASTRTLDAALLLFGVAHCVQPKGGAFFALHYVAPGQGADEPGSRTADVRRNVAELQR